MPNTNKYTVDGAVRAQIKEAITKFLADKAASRARMCPSVMIGNYEEGLAGLDTEYGMF